MSDWLEAYEQLSETQQENVQKWIQLNRFIANTLNIDEQKWFEGYLAEAMAHPLDYGFMQVCLPGFQGIDAPGDGESFSRMDDLAFTGSRIPVGAENNMGKLSPDCQEAINRLLENGQAGEIPLKPADVTQFQKIFNSKTLSRLKRPDFRKVVLAREPGSTNLVLCVKGGDILLQLDAAEFAEVLSKRLV